MTIGRKRSEPIRVAPDALIRRMEDMGAELMDLDARCGIDIGARIAANDIASFQDQNGNLEFRSDPFGNRASRDTGPHDNNWEPIQIRCFCSFLHLDSWRFSRTRILAGTPTAVAPSGTSLRTTALAPILTLFPM